MLKAASKIDKSPKTKSPPKVFEIGLSDENREINKEKCPYIAIIAVGHPGENLPSKVKVKRKKSDMV